MKRIHQITGSIGIRCFIVLVILILILWGGGFHSPSLARYAHSKIKVGMSSDEVRDALRGFVGCHLSCETDLNADGQPILEDYQCFKIISSLWNQQQIKKVTMHILFMGPMFLHNDFFIIFGPDGTVKEISPVKRWE